MSLVSLCITYIAIPILNITIWIKKKYSSDLKSSTAYKESYMHLRISTELKGLIVSQHVELKNN